jgi:flagellar hook-length control protein FliK
VTAAGALPVTSSAATLRTRASTGTDPRGTSGASPFASALDDALAADAPGSTGPDRAAERRTSSEGRGARADASTRAAERADDAADRAAERAAHRSATAVDRAADRAAHAARPAFHRSEPVSDELGRTGDEPVGEGTDQVCRAATESTDPAAAGTGTPAADAVRSGLPGAVWALLMGGPLTAAGSTDAAETAPGGAVPEPALAGAAPVAAAIVAASAVTPGVPVGPAADGVPATPPSVVAASATGAPTADAEVVLAGGTVVVAGDGVAPAPVPTPSGAPDGGAPPVVGTSTAAIPEAAVVPATAGAADPSTPPASVLAAAAGTPSATTAGDRTPDAGPAPAPSATPPAVGSSGAGGAQSAGAGGAGTASGSSTALPADSAPEAFPLVSGTTAPVTVSAPAAAAGATGSAAATPVGSQVARQVAVLRGGPDGAQTMTLVLSPESLGPVEVSVTLSRGTVDLMLRGAHDMGRAALLDGLPDLRRDLEAAGLSCSRLEVDRDTGGSWLARHSAEQQAQQQGSGDRGRQDRGDNRSRPWGAPADTAVSGPTPTSQRSTSSGVDLRV